MADLTKTAVPYEGNLMKGSKAVKVGTIFGRLPEGLSEGPLPAI